MLNMRLASSWLYLPPALQAPVPSTQPASLPVGKWGVKWAHSALRAGTVLFLMYLDRNRLLTPLVNSFNMHLKWTLIDKKKNWLCSKCFHMNYLTRPSHKSPKVVILIPALRTRKQRLPDIKDQRQIKILTAGKCPRYLSPIDISECPPFDQSQQPECYEWFSSAPNTPEFCPACHRPKTPCSSLTSAAERAKS